jgi:hypothetical protein
MYKGQYNQMQNYKEIMNLNSKCSYLVCGSCYNENGPKFSGAGHVTCPKCDDLHIIKCEEYVFKKGIPYAIYSPCYINYCQKWNE